MRDDKNAALRRAAHGEEASLAGSRALTTVLNGRPRPHFRTGPHTNCKRAYGAATMAHGPFQRFVRSHEPSGSRTSLYRM